MSAISPLAHAAQREENAENHSVCVQVKRLAATQTHVPAYKTAGAAGMDIEAAVDEPLVVAPGQRVLIPSGFAVAIPQGFEGQIRPRSGLALSHGVTVLNSPGTIDSDYRGEMKVLLINHGDADFTVRRGDRIAQLVICPVAHANVQVVVELDDTSRGDGGYGSTGLQ